jgi:hypothetical protein
VSYTISYVLALAPGRDRKDGGTYRDPLAAENRAFQIMLDFPAAISVLVRDNSTERVHSLHLRCGICQSWGNYSTPERWQACTHPLDPHMAKEK